MRLPQLRERSGSDARAWGWTARLAATVLIGLLLSCTPSYTLTEDALWNSDSCASCHPVQHVQWSGSMHAYASIDPVFLAMDARGQRETDGALGDFCVSCHAPGAVKLAGVTEAADLADVPDHLRGVGCASCHLVEAVLDDHNNALQHASDSVLRAGISDPLENTAHASAYSSLHDRDAVVSSATCGSCHDLVLDNGLHLERTFAEWDESLFNTDGPGRLSCGHCHMTGSEGQAALDGPVRTIHDHSMAGVDIALGDFPSRTSQRAMVQESLDDTVITELCVLPITAGSEITVRLENVGAGHRWPSGAAHDRRAWVRLVAYDGEEVIFSSGDVPEGTALHAVAEPDRWELHSVARGADGAEVQMFWDTVSLEERTLPVTTTLDPLDPDFDHTELRRWPLPGQVPDRVEVEVLIRPIGLDILESLVDSGDLDAGYLAEMPTFSLAGAAVTWDGELGSCVP